MSSRDNWERLVAAVLKREQIWQLCHEQSRSPSLSTVSSDFSGQILNFSSNSLEPISVSPPPPVPLTNRYVPQVSNNASGPITRKLFSAWYRRRKHKEEYLVDIPGNHLRRVRRFSLRELKVATDNFSDKNVLQYGYKARLEDGSLVGVKRLKHEVSSQSAEVRFHRELEINSIVAHSNVLDVLGFCISPKERLLVYPLMVNGSVASCLWGRPKSQPPLDWPLRKGIALETARGLAYLHEECSQKIIHRDIKAANILLDEDFEAFIANFELAIIMDHDVIDFEDAVRGTIGHIAPEYLSTGRCSEKTDVFGYGMFLLELITGQRAFDLARLANDEDMMLLDWVKRNFEERKWEMMVDPDCGGMYIDKEVRQVMQVALLCTQSHPVKRPKMSLVVRMLKDVDGLGERREERCNKVEMFCEEDLGIHLGRVRRFSLHELQVATENFSDKNVLGYGYNMVYKGWLADGSPVAVKKHKDRGAQGAEVQFQTELEINSISWHPNLLHMLGFCNTSNVRLIVYPLLANGSVASYLRGRHQSQPPLNWSVRKGIARGAARGLAYLHDKCDPPVIHRDIKAANILLDEDFEAVVGDFELAIIMDYDVTHATTSVVGTVGHRAPEHLASGICSEKTDVYGYGTFLLELITGQRASELAGLANEGGMMLLDWVKKNLEERKWEMLVDPDGRGIHMEEEVVEQLTQIALLCTQSNPERRPKMSEIVRMLQVGEFLAERWEECCNIEMFLHDVENHAYSSNIIFNDDISNVRADEISGPSSDRIFYDDISTVRPDELSGPR